MIEVNQVQQAGLSSHEAVLTVIDDCAVFQVFFSISQNDLFHEEEEACSFQGPPSLLFLKMRTTLANSGLLRPDI